MKVLHGCLQELSDRCTIPSSPPDDVTLALLLELLLHAPHGPYIYMKRPQQEPIFWALTVPSVNDCDLGPLAVLRVDGAIRPAEHTGFEGWMMGRVGFV